MDFYKTLDRNVQTKIQYVFELIVQVARVPSKFLSSVTGFEGLYEIRIEYQSNIYRIFCCFDAGNWVVLFNAFQKKTQKTPRKELEKADRLKTKYFEQKSTKK